MSYDTALILFVVFLIPACILVIVRLISLKREERAEQANLDVIFSHYKDDSLFHQG